MAIILNGTTGITNDGGYTGDGVVFADTTPANTLVTTTGGNVGIGTATPSNYGNTYIRNITAFLGDQNITVGAYYQPGIGQYGFINSGNTNNGNAQPLVFQGGGAERARIDSSGNLLVGATSTASNSGTGFKVVSGISGHWDPSVVTNQNNGTYSCWDVYSTGAGGYRFYVTSSGVVNAISTTISAISDERLKENIRDIDTGLNAVMALKPRRFDWKEGKGQDKKNAAGFIAQEFEEVFPECVGTSKAGEDGIEYKNINHETLIPTLVKAIQEQQAIIADQDVKMGQLVDQLTNAESTMNLLTEMFTESQQTVAALTARVEALEGTQP